MYIDCLARWDTQLNGLVELERRCQDLMREVERLNDRQEVLAGMVVSKRGHAEKSTQKVSSGSFR